MSKKKIANRLDIFNLKYGRPEVAQDYFLPDVDLFDAQNNAFSSERTFVKAGIKSLLSCIFKILGKENIDSLFFDFSKLSTPDQNALPVDYGCFWAENPDSAIIRKEMIDQRLKPLYEMLVRTRWDLYYHKGFFAEPSNPTAYYSDYQGQVIRYYEEGPFQKEKQKLEKLWLQFFRKKENPILFEKVDFEGEDVWIKNLDTIPDHGHFLSKQSYYWKPNLPEEELEMLTKGEIGIKYLHGLLHACFHNCFTGSPSKENTILISIPIVAAPTTSSTQWSSTSRQKDHPRESDIIFKGQGAIFLFLSLKEGYTGDLEQLIFHLESMAKDITFNYMLEVGLDLSNKAKTHSQKAEENAIKARENALRTALSGIVSRNGSHNLGSHVLSSLVGDFQDLADTHNLFTYIQERMDFIALTSTDFPEWTFPVWFINDLMHRFYKQKILLDNIAGSENLMGFPFQSWVLENPSSRLFRVKINTGTQNEEVENRLLIKLKYVKLNKQGEIISEKEVVSIKNENERIEEDTLVAVPGGIIGYHALFIILENIIRNSAKYGWGTKVDREENNLIITLEIREKIHSEFIELRIWDNISTLSKEEGFPLVESIREKLVKPLIHLESGEMDKSDLGIAEMRIAAGFLNVKNRKEIGLNELENILFQEKENHKEGEPSYNGFIDVYAQEGGPEGVGKYYLGYKFPLPKPKEVLFMGKLGEDLKKKVKTKLKGRHVFFYDEGVAYRFMDSDFLVIYDNPSLGSSLSLVDEISTKGLNQSSREEKKDLLDHLDIFPGRVIIISDRLRDLREQGELIGVLRRRIITISEAKFRSQLKQTNDLYLFLYQMWIDHLKYTKFGTAFDAKKLELMIELSGKEAQGNLNIFKMIYNTFHKIIASSSNPYNHYGFIRDSKELLSKVLGPKQAFDNAIDNLQKIEFKEIRKLLFEGNDQKNTTQQILDTTTFVSAWIEIGEIDEYLTNPRIQILENLLRQTFDHYHLSSKRYYQKYQEAVETLPQVYFAKNDSRENLALQNKLALFNKKLNEGVKQPKDKEIEGTWKISYNRHYLPQKSDGLLYGEALSGTQIYFSTLNNLSSSRAPFEKFLFQLCENGLFKILVIDERITSYYSKNPKDRLERGGIFLPSMLYIDNKVLDMNTLKLSYNDKNNSDIRVGMKMSDPHPNLYSWKESDGGNQITSPSIEEEEDRIGSFIPSQLFSISEFDVIIFHQGILDKIFEHEEKDDEKVINKFIRRCKLLTPYVLITSGRGEPDNLPESTKFVPFSNLQSFFMKEYPEKLSFTQVLMKVAVIKKQSNLSKSKEK